MTMTQYKSIARHARSAWDRNDLVSSKRCIEWDPTLVVQIRISPRVGFYACGTTYVFELAVRELSMGYMRSLGKTMVLLSSHNIWARSITRHTHTHAP